MIVTNLTSICCVYSYRITQHPPKLRKLQSMSKIVKKCIGIWLIFHNIFICFLYNGLKTPISLSARCLALDALNDSTWQRHQAEKNRCFKCIVHKRSKIYYEKLTICKCDEKKSMTIGCNIWIICLKLIWFFMVLVVCCNFLNLYGR